MTSPRKTRSLASLHTLKSSTRAAAGLRQAPASETTRSRVNSIGSITYANRDPQREPIEIDEQTASDSDSDNDLDRQHQPVMLPPPKRTPSISRRPQADPQTTPRPHRQSNLRDNSTSTEKSPNERPSPLPRSKSRVQSLFDDLDELPESSRIHYSISNTAIASASESPETSRGNNLNPKKSQHSEVPTFLV
jgi:hypothetical protein